MNTGYINLPEIEKLSNKKEAENIINNIKNFRKNKPAKGIIVAGFGAIGKSFLSEKYTNVIDMESGFYAHINSGVEDIPVEKRKGTTVRPPNPEWPKNYYEAIMKSRKEYDIVLTSMHWDLLKFYEDNNIPYYLVFPEQGLENEYRERCYNRGNNEKFTEHMIQNIKLWNEKLKNYKPLKIIYLKSGEYLEDALRIEKLL